MQINFIKYGLDYFVCILIALSIGAINYNKYNNNKLPIYIDPPFKQNVWYC